MIVSLIRGKTLKRNFNMKRLSKVLTSLMLMTVMVLGIGCDKKQELIEEEAEVETSQVTEITSSTAKAGGMVVSDGNSMVVERGVCWTDRTGGPSPTIADYHISAGAGLGSFNCELTGLEANTKYRVCAYAFNSVGVSYGSTVEFKTKVDNGGGGGNSGGGNGTYNGHDYVDLGLPSGTLWATCNVGANMPEDYGDYFAWGETGTKTFYNRSTYMYCNGSYDQLTKYCYDSQYGYNGFTDNLTILLPEDDAATTNWGSGWRMPMEEQWMELYQNTNSIWTTQNGVNGRLFKADNENSLFLPASGTRWYDELLEAGSYGSYWSSSLYTDNSGYAWYFDFGSDDYYMMDHHGRSIGQSVRAVRSARQN